MGEMQPKLDPDSELDFALEVSRWDYDLSALGFDELKYGGPDGDITRRDYADGTTGVRDKDGTATTLHFSTPLPLHLEPKWPKLN